MKATFLVEVECPDDLRTGPGRWDEPVTADKVRNLLECGIIAMKAVHLWGGKCKFNVAPVNAEAHSFIIRCELKCRGMFVGVGNDPVYREHARRFTEDEAKTFVEMFDGHEDWKFSILPAHA